MEQCKLSSVILSVISKIKMKNVYLKNNKGSTFEKNNKEKDKNIKLVFAKY